MNIESFALNVTMKENVILYQPTQYFLLNDVLLKCVVNHINTL